MTLSFMDFYDDAPGPVYVPQIYLHFSTQQTVNCYQDPNRSTMWPSCLPQRQNVKVKMTCSPEEEVKNLSISVAKNEQYTYTMGKLSTPLKTTLT